MTPEEIKLAIQKETADALAPLKTQLGQFAEQIKPLSGLGEQLKTLTESVAALEIGGSKGKPGEKKADPAAAATTGAGLTTEQATELFKKMLAERDTAAQTTAQQQAAHDEWMKKNAPKLAGTKTASRIFAGAATDEARKAALDEYVADLKSQGIKPPDLGSTPAVEGGSTVDAADAKAKKLEAIRNDKSTGL